jgi:ketosteroid isomerase-like protein
MNQSRLFFALNSSIGFFIGVLVLIGLSQSSAAQTLTRTMVEKHVQDIAAAYTAHDAQAVARLDPAAPGYGFRTLQPRRSDRPYIDALNSFFANQDYYRIELNELNSEIDGDIAVAWGFWTEDFKEKNRSPEKVRVRITYTLKYDGKEWRTLLFHRDAQTFDEKGGYLRAP